MELAANILGGLPSFVKLASWLSILNVGRIVSALCVLCPKNAQKKRKIVEVAQEKQAKKMLKRSEASRPPLLVGDNIRIGIPR